MSRRRKNPHPQRAVNARTVLKAEKEEEPLVLRSRMIKIPKDAEDDEDEEANRQRRRKGRKKGEKFQNQRERSVARGERENRAKTMIPPNANQKPDEPAPRKPALDATTTTISPPALMQQKVSPKGGGLNQTNNSTPDTAAPGTPQKRGHGNKVTLFPGGKTRLN